MEDAPREFIDDLDEAFLDDVVHVLLEKDLRLDRLGEVMHELEVALVEDRAFD